MKLQTVLIIGGGIGGLLTAIALRQRGIPAMVFEAAPENKPVGAGILMAANALQVLQRLGLADAVAARGIDIATLPARTFGVVDSNGRPIMTGFDLEQIRRTFGHSLIAIRRSELHAALLAALPNGTVQPGRKLIHVAQTPASVSAHFEDGSTVDGDVLIAADGIHSAVRNQLWPAVRPRYSGQTSYRALLPYRWDALGALPCVEVWGGPMRFGFTPVSDDKYYWFAVLRAPAGERDASTNAAKSVLLDMAGKLHPHARTLIEATPPDNMLRTDISDLPPLPRWHEGRIVLLGDAAHATTPNLGQGGCQAIEDGFALALCLAEEATHGAAFARYQQLRKPKADWITRTARQVGEAAHWPAWLHGPRNALLRAMPARTAEAQTNRIYRLEF